MKSWMIARRTFLAAALATGLAGSAMADGHQVVDSIHFLIQVAQEEAGMEQLAEQGKR